MLKQQITSKEFVQWKFYLEREWNEHTKQDYYFAHICSTILNVFTGGKSRTMDFLLKFIKPEISKGVRKRQRQRQSMRSMKNFFSAALGINSEDLH